MSIEETISEDLGFKLDTKEHGIPIFDALDLETLGNQPLKLLAIHDDLIVVSNGKSLKFFKSSDTDNITTIGDQFNITQLHFADDKLYILDNSVIKSLPVDKLKNGDYTFEDVNSGFVDILVSSAGVLGLNKDSELYHDSNKVASGVSAFCWTKNSYIYAYKNKPTELNNKKINIDDMDDYTIVNIFQLNEQYLFIAYDKNDAELDDHDIRSFLLEEKDGEYSASEIDVAPAFGSATRISTYYHQKLSQWYDTEDLTLITSSLSTDIGIIDSTNGKIPEVIGQSEDIYRALFPIDSDTGDDCSPIGFAVSLQELSSKIIEPCPGVEDVTGKLPKLYTLLHTGSLVSWWVFHKSGILNDKVSLDRAIDETAKTSSSLVLECGPSTSSPEEVKPKPADNPFGASTSSAFGSKTVSEPTKKPETASGFGSSGFGSSGFGSTGFGSSSGFGNTGFGSSGFGNSGFGSSGFGNAAAKPAETTTSSAFGKTGFGSSATTSGSASGFGSSGFGSSGFGKLGDGKPSIFGDDKPLTSTSSPFASIGDKKESPFAAIGKKEESPFANISDKKESPFANFGKKDEAKKEESPFAAIGKKVESPFASLGKKDESPFGNLGKKEEPKKEQSPFGNFGKKEESPFANLGKKDETKEQESPFASFGKKQDSPFANLGKKDETQKSESAFANLGKKDEPKTEESPFAGFGKKAESPFASFGKSEDVKKQESPFANFGKAEEPKKQESPFANLGKKDESPFASFGKKQESPFAKFGEQKPSEVPLPQDESEENESPESEEETSDYDSDVEQEEVEELEDEDELEAAIENVKLDKVIDEQLKVNEEEEENLLKDLSIKPADTKPSTQKEPEPEKEEIVDPVKFLMFDGFTRESKSSSNGIMDKISSIFETTEGNLKVLEENVNLLGKYIEYQEKQDLSIPHAEFSQVQVPLSLRNEALSKELSELNELASSIQKSHFEKVKLDKLYSQLSLFATSKTENSSILKNRPLDVKDDVMRTKLREKLAKIKNQEQELLKLLMPFKAKNSMNTKTIGNIEKIVFQINEQILDHSENIDDLTSQIDKLNINKNHEPSKSDSSITSNFSKIKLRKKLHQTKSIMY